VATDMMKCLVFDKSSMAWDKSRGFNKVLVPAPVLDEKSEPEDADNVLVKVIYAGFCGSDRGIWNRTAFKGMIFDSLKREKKSSRIIGHEMVGEIVQAGLGAGGQVGRTGIADCDQHVA
jgi:threonine 3-dehydrogenase